MHVAGLGETVTRLVASPISLTLALALALPLLALAGCTAGERPTLAAATAETRDPGYSASDAEIIQTGTDGAPRYRLRAAHIEQDPRTLEVGLRTLTLETRDRDAARWQVEAPRGTLSGDAERLRLEGGVRLQGGDARDADLLRIATPTLDYDLRELQARAAGEVRITLQGHVLEGNGLEANLRTRQVRLNSNVHGRFTP